MVSSPTRPDDCAVCVSWLALGVATCATSVFECACACVCACVSVRVCVCMSSDLGPARALLMIATAFLGSLTFMLGVSRFAHGDSNFNIVSMIQDPVLVECGTWECYVMGLGWVVIGGIGLVVQVCSHARVCCPQCASHWVL